MTRSFRDPAGSCWLTDKNVFRVLDRASAGECEAFLASGSARRFLANGKLVGTKRVPAPDIPRVPRLTGWGASDDAMGPGVVFEHERIRFPSYPYEWPPEMLWEAGRLTLELASDALADGYGLKDATPYNVLFRGPEPVFVDVPSFEKRAAGDPVWRPHAQFVRTFLLPLLVNRRWGLSLADLFTTHRDGLQPQDVYHLCGWTTRLSPQVLSLVSIPTWLRPRAQAQGERVFEKRQLGDPAKARFILESLLSRSARSLESLRPKAGKNSTWSDYMATHSYGEPAFAAKEKFVSDALAEFRPGRVLDAGANTGHFSALAAKAGAEVVAIDLDPACVGVIWQRARAEKLNVLPLVIDLSRPSPAMGWKNAECPSFLERAAGGFDCVLMLALIHHLLVTERIPLEEIVSLAADLTTRLLVIELVLPQDPMFRILTRGREDLHRNFDQGTFERACSARFVILRSQELPGTHRRLYALQRKAGNGDNV
ncbi:MAG TPA: class I SAM-dependent methyltransferase [Verrucomicrobiae bacterium]